MTPPFHDNNPFSDQSITLEGHSKSVWSVAFSPTSQLLASGSDDHTIRLWNAKSGKEVATLKGHSSEVKSVVFSPDGTILASGSEDATIKLWDVESRVQIATLVEGTNGVNSISFSSDGTRVASGSTGPIQVWEVKSRTIISVLTGHSGIVLTVAFSPDNRRIASGSYDYTVRLWDPVSQSSIATCKGHTDIITSVAFSPNGEYLASASYDKTIRLWNAARGTHIATIEGHPSALRSVTFSPNGKYLASGSYDRTIRIWDVGSKPHVSTLKGHSVCTYSLAFSPDGSRLASGSDDKTVRLWTATPGNANDTESPIHASQLTELTQTIMPSEEDLISPTSISTPLHNDITGSVSLDTGTPIGYGGFGDLFLGIHKDSGKVALKKPRRLLDEPLIRRFLREVDLWCSVSHKYVLPCLGMCRIGVDVYVVSPFIENGDLLSCLSRGKNLNRSKLLYEVTEALSHLHHRGIVHGDVKAQNILLSDDGSALLCDFGLAKAFDTMATSSDVKGSGSIRWMAPELFKNGSRSMASDVYSLGITIAEVLSGQPPYLEIPDNFAVMYHIMIDNGRPPKIPFHSPEGKSYSILWETAEKCWATKTEDRPHMAQVLGMLFPLTRERN